MDGVTESEMETAIEVLIELKEEYDDMSAEYADIQMTIQHLDKQF